MRADYNTIDTQRRDALDTVTGLDGADKNDPARRPSPNDMQLLDALPVLRLNLADAPQELLHNLFDATRLTINVHGPASDRITVTITLVADQLPAISSAAQATPDAGPLDHTPRDQQKPTTAIVPHAVCAPGRAPQGWEPVSWSSQARRPCRDRVVAHARSQVRSPDRAPEHDKGRGGDQRR